MKRRKIRNPRVRRHAKRKESVRRRLARADRPMLTVYRSARHIYAQIVDPHTGRTLVTVSSCKRGAAAGGDDGYGGNVQSAEKVGEAIARIARERDIERVVFNRNGFLYHGRVRALAEAARRSGLVF